MPPLSPCREYRIAEVNRRQVSFSYWPVRKVSRRMALQPMLFSADPWTVMQQAIRQECSANSKEEATALLEQARDYYHAATSGEIAAAKPVLVYYCYLNAVKAFLLHRGRRPTYEKAKHGLQERLRPGGQELVAAFLTAYPSTADTANVFDDFLAELSGAALTANRDYQLVNLLPQIVTGHRLWGAASGRAERFVSVERVEFAQDSVNRILWANIVLRRGDLTRLYCTQNRCLREGLLLNEWTKVRLPQGFRPSDAVLLQQNRTIAYGQHPSQEIGRVADSMRSCLWTVVSSMPPYRRRYLHLSPPAEEQERLPQMLSMYAVVFYLGSITRYRPQHFDRIVETPYGGFVQSFLQEQPRQFLYMLASEFARQEVTQPALA